MSSKIALQSIAADVAALKSQLRHLYLQWCVSGPTLESSIALAAMVQEESGHARILARLAGDSAAEVDAGALVPIDKITSWPVLVGVVGPLEVALAGLLNELKGSDVAEFNRNVSKIAIEERYHANFFLGWFEELGASRNLASAAFAEAKIASEERISSWLSACQPRLDEAGVIIPLASGVDGDAVGDDSDRIACVHCGSVETVRTAAFGGSLMTSIMKCRACGGQFEGVRWRSAVS